MRLKKLRIENFKGVVDFTLEPDGQDISVYGENATGKTTIFDSVLWLLTGKDSNGKADFQIKPVDEAGQEIHNLETSVTAMFEINGTELSLKKIFKEKWAKKRGQASQEFSGHTTDYFIDDVPEQKKAFDEKIKAIIDDKLFSILSNPFEFNNIHWQERRRILFDVCGNVSDTDVIDSDPDLAVLTEILNGKSIEDHKKKIVAKRQEINRELTEIPARIDELSKSIQDVQKPELAAKSALREKLAAAQEKRNTLTSTAAKSEKQAVRNQIKADILKIQNEAAASSREKRKPIQDKIDSIEKEIRTVRSTMADLNDSIKKDQDRNKITVESMESLRNRWKAEDAKEYNGEDVCPTCGQDLPEDQVLAAVEKFNQAKATALEKINTEGKTLKAATLDRDKSIKAATEKIESLNKSLTSLEESLSEQNTALSALGTTAVDVSGLENQIDAIDSEVKALESGSTQELEKVDDEIRGYKARIAEIEAQEAALTAAEKTKARIIELGDREKFLAGEFEKLEAELYLIDRFTVKKVELLEDNINSKFSLARFKLFDIQINGGINEVCETLYNGVPFNSGLNNAARINTGLDIINTLSDYYGFYVPIFIDNAESVTSIIKTKSQQIRLVVDPDYKKLTWKTETKETE